MLLEKIEKKTPQRASTSKNTLNIIFFIITMVMMGLAMIYDKRIDIGIPPIALKGIILGVELFGIIFFIKKGNDL
jgi:hypothetical protein